MVVIDRAIVEESASTTHDLPWKKKVEGPSFSSEYPTEFRESAVPGGGLGWFAKVYIPAGVCLRRVSIQDKTLHRFEDELELRATGWDIDDAVNYGIGHKSDRSAIFFLDPGTACNHADRTKQPTVMYDMTKKGVMEIWSILPIRAGEEMWIDYADNFCSPKWYEDLMTERNLTPLSCLGAAIDKIYQQPGVVDMTVTCEKDISFYVRSARNLLEGLDGEDCEKREPASVLNLSGTGDAVDMVIAVAAAVEQDGLGSIKMMQRYPNFVSIGSSGDTHQQSSKIVIEIYNCKR